MFKVGDKVRINDQSHPFCGFYGVVNCVSPQGEEVGIAGSNWVEGEALVGASQDQIEAA